MSEEQDDKVSDDLTLIENLEAYEHEKDAEDVFAETLPQEGDTEEEDTEEESTEEEVSEDFLETLQPDATEEIEEKEEEEEKEEDVEQSLEEVSTPVVSEEPDELQDSPIEPTVSPTTKENFEDVREFAQAIGQGNIAQGGNPPFSVIMKNIRYKEDGEGILGILSDYGLCDGESKAVYEQGIAQGALIVPQISEYAAIHLAHKCRRFAVDIQFGLSDEIYPAKSYSQEEKGLVSKRSLAQNKEEEVSLQTNPSSIEDMVVSGTPTLSGYKIQKYIGVFFSHKMLSEKEFVEMPSVFVENKEKDEGESSYGELVRDLKNQAYKAKANGVINICCHVTPMPKSEYKITCTGTAVWVTKETL